MGRAITFCLVHSLYWNGIMEKSGWIFKRYWFSHWSSLFISLRVSEHIVRETPTQTHAKFISTEICRYGAVTSVTSVNQKQKCLQLTARTEQMFRTHRGTAHSVITWREGTRYQPDRVLRLRPYIWKAYIFLSLLTNIDKSSPHNTPSFILFL